MKMCAAFAANGHEVTLYVPARSAEREPAPAGPHGFYGVDSSFRIVSMPWLPVFGKAQIFGWITAMALKRSRPDIVYGRDVIACTAAAALGCRTILESHMPAWQARGRIPTYFKRLVRSRNLMRLVVISQALKDLYLERVYLDGDRIMVAHDGADEMENVSRRANWMGRDGVLQVGYVGQLHEGKGAEVVAALAPMMPDVDFHVVGGRDKDVARLKEEATANNLLFHGFVPHSEVPGCIARLDVCLLPNQRVVRPDGQDNGPSRTNISSYTSPLKLFEYMAQARCIVASDHSVLREVLNYSNAVLVPPGDIDAWRKAVDQLRDAAVRTRLGAQAHADFVAKYTWNRRAAAVLH